MKKFTKGCLITALVLFVTGCVFCGVFGVLGGTRQLREINVLKTYGLNLGSLGNLRLGFNGFGFSIWDDDWFDDDWGSDWDEHSHHVNIATKGSMERTECRAEEIREIDIEIGAANLVIKESEDEYIWIENNSSLKTVKYQMAQGVFKIKEKQNFAFWNTDIKGQIYLYLPAGMNLSAIDLEAGAGSLESIALAADEIDMEVGAGTVTMQGLEGSKVEIDLGAGDANVSNITVDKLTIEGGAGNIVVNDSNVTDINLDIGMGDIEVSGRITGNADITCGMGNVTMKLQGAETDYNYNVECNMGNVKIGGSQYSGILDEKVVDNGSRSKFDIECGMGTIEINFTK